MGEDPQRVPSVDELEETLLGGELRYTRLDVARLADVPSSFSDRIWRAFGYPRYPDDAVAYTEGDVAAVGRLARLISDDVLGEDDVIRMVRAVGQTMSRLAEWQIDLLGARLTGDVAEPPSEQQVATLVDVAEKHIDDFEPLLLHAWRRQLAAAGTRAMAAAVGGPDDVAARTVAAVGFADMVSFTQMSRELDEFELARVVERFEETTSDVVAAHGGRLVKTLGDEILYTADLPEAAAEIALAISEAIRKEPEVPDVRVGLSYGSVLPLMGDVFGTTVNLAARLTAIARPGSVVVDSALAMALSGSAGYDVTRIVRRPARGLGIIQPYVLRRRQPGLQNPD